MRSAHVMGVVGMTQCTGDGGASHVCVEVGACRSARRLRREGEIHRAQAVRHQAQYRLYPQGRVCRGAFAAASPRSPEPSACKGQLDSEPTDCHETPLRTKAQHATLHVAKSLLGHAHPLPDSDFSVRLGISRTSRASSFVSCGSMTFPVSPHLRADEMTVA